jgi:hypothetical protein
LHHHRRRGQGIVLWIDSSPSINLMIPKDLAGHNRLCTPGGNWWITVWANRVCTDGRVGGRGKQKTKLGHRRAQITVRQGVIDSFPPWER